jgi:hypothetical protein
MDPEIGGPRGPLENRLAERLGRRTGQGVLMNIALERISVRGGRAATVIAGAVLALMIGTTGAASAAIYKCTAADRGLVYTDQPCKGGEVLEVHAGEVDRDAVARLQVARDMLDRGAAARIAAQQRDADLGAFAAVAQRQRDEDQAAADTDYTSPYDSYVGWYPGTGQMHRPHPPRERPPRGNPRRHAVAPRGPFVVPRS